MKLRVLLVEDDNDVRWSLAAACKDNGCEVFEASSLAEGRELLGLETDVLLLDLMLPDGDGLDLLREALRAYPRQLVIVMSGVATVERAVAAMTQGAFHFLAKPFSNAFLFTLLDRARELTHLRYSVDQATADKGPAIAPRGTVMQAVETQVQKLAPTNAKIMLLGPSGSGKTYYAQRIHELSGRKGPFVEANCGALSPGLIESELFGHEKGAFTDAKALKRGVFEQAHGGTLLLDEIGDMPLEQQTKLLKVVETNSITRVGAEKPITVDVRLICATHRKPEALVKAGTFREDLYYRLNVGVVTIPPLKERGLDDFLALAESQLAIFAKDNGRKFKGIDPRAGELLYYHPWGGNVRELRNVLERIVIYENGEMLTADMVRHHLMPRSEQLAQTVLDASGFCVSELVPLADLKERYYQFVIDRCDGNITQAAKVLGISRRTLEREREAGRV